MARAPRPSRAAYALLLLVTACGGETESAPLASPVRDAGPEPCNCMYRSVPSCHVPDAPDDPECLRAAGERNERVLFETAECFDGCGDKPNAALHRCIAPLARLRYEYFAQRSELVTECMGGDDRRCRGCIGEGGVALLCDDSEELAACREGK